MWRAAIDCYVAPQRRRRSNVVRERAGVPRGGGRQGWEREEMDGAKGREREAADRVWENRRRRRWERNCERPKRDGECARDRCTSFAPFRRNKLFIATCSTLTPYGIRGLPLRSSFIDIPPVPTPNILTSCALRIIIAGQVCGPSRSALFFSLFSGSHVDQIVQ